MIVTVNPSFCKGEIKAPTSKSAMQRACAAALLAGGVSIINNPGHSNDDKAAVKMIIDLGATVQTLADGSLRIISNGIQPATGDVNIGESGLGIRMFAPIIALSNHEITINGKGSLLNRPMDFFDEIFPALSVRIQSTQGRLPLHVKGPLRPASVSIDGSLSSQFLTGLLMAYGGIGAEDVTITVDNLKSRPYIDLTLDVMKAFDLKLPENNAYQTFYFAANNQPQRTREHVYTVEGDWSGAAFLLVAGALGGPVTIKGMQVTSSQADKAVLQALTAAGADIQLQENEITVRKKELNAFVFDATDCPDLFPPLVALAAHCQGVSVIKGTGRLTHKESNRALTLQEEFGKMGVNIRLVNDEMHIGGNGLVKGASVHSRHDHRIAMACAVAALQAEGKTDITAAEAINKSYPDFFDDLLQLQAKISIP